MQHARRSSPIVQLGLGHTPSYNENATPVEVIARNQPHPLRPGRLRTAGRPGAKRAT